MNAQNLLDAIRDTSRVTEDVAVLAALRGIVARAKRYEAQDKPSVTCPQCRGTRLKRCEATAQSGDCPSWRCLECDLKFIVTNPSALK